MTESQKVSWRTAGSALLGCALATASVVAIIRSDGVRPTSLTSSAATRWLAYQPEKLVVLADGLSGGVLAKIDASSDTTGEVAVQGAGGAFLVAPEQGSVRTISTAKLQLGTAQAVGSLSEKGGQAKFRVGASGLTVVNSATDEANVIAVDDITRKIDVPPSNFSSVAADGSMWLFTTDRAIHLNIDGSRRSVPLPGTVDSARVTTVGAHAVSFDNGAGMIHWLGGGDVRVDSIPNSADAVLQQPGDEQPCVWLGAGDTLACVGQRGIDQTLHITGMRLAPGDRLAVAGAAAAVVRARTSQIERLDLAGERMITRANPTVALGADLTITAANDMIWIDEQSGPQTWVVHRFGTNVIHKNDETAPLLDATGQVQVTSIGAGVPGLGTNGDAPGNDAETRSDENGQDDPPVAVDDGVTARSGNSIIIPVTRNDFDPDGEAIGVDTVTSPGHGSSYVLDGGSVAYAPEPGFSGSDSFQYTIVDEHGNQQSATVHVQLFSPDSPNQPPIAQDDQVKTRLSRAVTIDVLTNDTDPERDTLSVPTFQSNSSGGGKITDTTGPSGLPALRYEPTSPTPGIFTFTYQAADPQGGTSPKTTVTVDVSSDDAPNVAPSTNPDAVRVRVGITAPLDVLANDVDDDGDLLTFKSIVPPRGVTAVQRAGLLDIRLAPGADNLSVIHYVVTDGIPGHERPGRVLVMKIGDTAPNRPPVANPDADRVVIGHSVTIPVTQNDVDPDGDIIRLLDAEQPADGAGTTRRRGRLRPVHAEPPRHHRTQTRHVPILDLRRSQPRAIRPGWCHRDGRSLARVPRSPKTIRPTPSATSRSTSTCWPTTAIPSGGDPHLIGKPTCENGGTATPTRDERVTFDPPPGEIGTFRCRYTIGNTQGLRADGVDHRDRDRATAGEPRTDLHRSHSHRECRLAADNLRPGSRRRTSTRTHWCSPPSASVTECRIGQSSHRSRRASRTRPRLPTRRPSTQIDTVEVTISDQHDGNVPGRISIKIDPDPFSASPAGAGADHRKRSTG